MSAKLAFYNDEVVAVMGEDSSKETYTICTQHKDETTGKWEVLEVAKSAVEFLGQTVKQLLQSVDPD